MPKTQHLLFARKINCYMLNFSNASKINIQSASVWRAGPTDRSLDSGSGCSTPELGTKNIYGMLHVSHPHEGDHKSAVLSLKYGGLLIKSAASRYQMLNGECKKKVIQCRSMFGKYFQTALILVKGLITRRPFLDQNCLHMAHWLCLAG